MAAEQEHKDARKRLNYVQVRIEELAKERKALMEERKTLAEKLKAVKAK